MVDGQQEIHNSLSRLANYFVFGCFDDGEYPKHWVTDEYKRVFQEISLVGQILESERFRRFKEDLGNA